MSLYHEAAAVVLKAAEEESGFIQSIVFGKKDWKSPPKTLFALAAQSVRWSRILADVIDRSGILGHEKQLTPAIALVLTHDLLLAKRGLALPQNHGLAACILRHKARLTAELTKARIREGCSTTPQLKEKLDHEVLEEQTSGDGGKIKHPRWIRINRILSTVEEQMASTFAGYRKVDSVSALQAAGQNLIYHDEHIPYLVAVPPMTNLASSKAYKEGKIIFQDKASCFPAYLLGYDAAAGSAIDACAAPGNKTTHLAAIAHVQLDEDGRKHTHIFACEKDALRSQTLTKMTELAGAGRLVKVRQKQNFLKLDPTAREFANVTALLLDPSCSGSGIVGRDEGSVKVYLPSAAQPASGSAAQPTNGSKKRKRGNERSIMVVGDEKETAEAIDDSSKLQARLASLSEFQLRLLLHAMTFPAAQRITYSTCSVHAQENENVVMQALTSDIALSRGWKILLRDAQVNGMRRWHIRGDVAACQAFMTGTDGTDVAEACIRCEKSGVDGTMGFFVAAFVREAGAQERRHEAQDEGDWGGFEDG